MTKDSNILDKPFNSLTRDELKKGILSKFGTISRFCRLTKRQTMDFNNLLLARDLGHIRLELEKVYKEAKSLDRGLVEGELTEQNREYLKNSIYNQHKNISAFCKKNTEFTASWICNVLYGKTAKKTPKVKRLASVLNVKLD